MIAPQPAQDATPQQPAQTPQVTPAKPQQPAGQAASGIPGLAPMTPPSAPSVAAVPQAPQSATPQVTGAMQQFGPGQDLRTTQINPTASPRLQATQGNVDTVANQLANGPDRFQLAQDRFKTYSDQTDPAFQASIRSATQQAAANGAIGSGMLGTTYGNLGLQRSRDLQNERDTLFNNALEGTIGDTRANAGILSGLEGQQYGEGVNDQNALRGERSYQNGMEQQAYDRGVQGLQLEDQLTNSQFGRGLAQEQLGLQNNPAQMQMMLSGIYGQQASDAGKALSGLVQSTTANNAIQGAYGQPTSSTAPTAQPVSRSGDVIGGAPGTPNIDSILASIYGQQPSATQPQYSGAPY